MSKQPAKTPTDKLAAGRTEPPKAASAATVVCRFMDAEEVLAVTGYKNRPTLYAQIAKGFPAPVALGPLRSNGRASKAMWVRAEVEAWIADLIAAPRHLERKHQARPA